MRKTVRWYLDHQDWVQHVTSGAYREWVTTHYGPLTNAERRTPNATFLR